jgi:hypothetical protein
LSEATVSRFLREEQTRVKALRVELAADFLQRELDHLDALERSMEDDMAEPTRRGPAIKLLLEIKARRAKYLGLDKPAEVKHSLTLEDIVSGSSES